MPRSIQLLFCSLEVSVMLFSNVMDILSLSPFKLSNRLQKQKTKPPVAPNNTCLLTGKPPNHCIVIIPSNDKIYEAVIMANTTKTTSDD